MKKGKKKRKEKLVIKIFISILFTLDFLYGNSTVDNNCKKTINSIKKEALNEDSAKQYLMGIIYQNGLCINKSSVKAFEYFSASNSNGYPLAKFELAEMYYYGEGTKRNYKKAYEIYNKILIDNERDATIKVKLGDMNIKGKGVDKNLTMAKKLYEEAAKSNHLTAFYNLGLMYMSGLGVDKNLTKAIEYLKRPANNSHPSHHNRPKAMYYLARALYEKNKEKNKDIILELITMSAIEGLVDAQVSLGQGYILGENVDKDMKKAKYLIKKAKDKNSTKAIELWDKYELWKY